MRTSQISRSLTADPVPVTSVLPQQDSSAPDEQWQRVTATGHYLPDGQVLARLRVVEGDPAFEVLVPFAVDGGPTVLVDRGYVKPEQGSQVPAFAPPPTETVTITARLRDSEPAAEGKEPFRQDGAQQVYSINTAQIASLVGVPLAGSYLQLVEDQPGGLGVIALPHLDAGPVPVLRHPVDRVRHPRADRVGLLRGFGDQGSADARRRPSGAARRTPPLTTEEKLADRYGKRR